MPYHLEQSGSGYYVIGPSGRHSRRPLPRQRAVAQMRALYANEKDAGPPLSGPGGLLGTPGLARPKWRQKGCTCGVATKEQLAPGITRIRGNLCNVHGRYGPCDAGASRKRKPKGRKGRAAAKPKQTPEQRAQTRAAQQDANRAKVDKEIGLFEDASGALDDLRQGKAVTDDGGLVKMGLAERAADGSYRLTPAGRALAAARSAGDAGRARDIISAARDRKGAQTERQQAADARHAAAEQRQRDAEAKRQQRDAERAKKKPKAGGGGKGRSSTASSSGSDIRAQREEERQADRAQRQREHEQDRAQRQREHEEDRARAQQEREQDRAQRQQQPVSEPRVAAPQWRVQSPHRRRMKAAETYGGVKRSTLRDSVFAGPDRSFPIKTAQDVRDAVRSLGRTKHDKAVVKQGIIRRARAIGAMDALPESWRAKSWTVARWESGFGRWVADVPTASFAVFKSADGAYRWIARSTTAYRDRDGEIITTKALEDDAARMTATGMFGPLRYWHIGAPDPFNAVQPWGPGLDIGTCDYSTVIGRTSIESGTFTSAELGRAFAESAADYELSPGFFHPPDQPDAAGEYASIRRFERSVVPVKYGRASNLFTGMTVKEHRMTPEEYERRMKAFAADMQAKGVPPDVAGAVVASMEQADKSATAQGIAFKSEDGGGQAQTDPWLAVGLAVKAALAAPEQTTVKAPMAPASLMQMGATDEADAATEELDDGSDDETAEESEIVGNMPVADFEALLTRAFQSAIASFGSDITTRMAAVDEAVKGMGYARTKAEGETAARIALLEAELATLKGVQPRVVEAEALAALKSDGPQAPPDANAPQVPANATPIQQLAARLASPPLYQSNAQGFLGWSPPPSQS